MAALTSSHIGSTVVCQSLFQGYQLPTGAYDEVFAAPGILRPHWEPVVQRLDSLGGEELTRRWEQARRLLHDDGVTYNVYGDPQGMHRPWELDALPLVIAPEEWERLGAALVQRAQVLNALLADVYGPQKLLRAGLLPPELVFAHPGFLRLCHNVWVPQEQYLHLYAADLARAPDGQRRRLNDPRQSGLSENPGWPEACGCHSAAPGRCLLRSARTAPAIRPRGGRAGPGRASRHCGHRQCLGEWEAWNVTPKVDSAEASLPALEQALLTGMFDAQWPHSVRATLTDVQRVAATVRDRISLDSWRILSHLQQGFTPPQSSSLPPLSAVLELLNHTLITLPWRPSVA